MKSKCKDIYVYEMSFKRNEKNIDADASMEVGIETNYARNNDAEKKDSRLILNMTVGDEEDEEQAFWFKIRIAGIFDWSDLSEEEAEEQIYAEGMDTLLSFARTYLHDMAEKAGLGGIILPILNLEEEN